MRRKVFKYIGLGLGLQGLLLGDFCEVRGLEHKPSQCPVDTLEFRLDESWNSDVEEGFVREHELEAQRLRKIRKWHHYQSLQKKVAKLDWEPLDSKPPAKVGG
jgi:hypothetical protein